MIFFSFLSIYLIIERESDSIKGIIFFVISSLVVLYFHKTHLGYGIPLKKRKELKRIELENVLLQKKIELKKTHGTPIMP